MKKAGKRTTFFAGALCAVLVMQLVGPAVAAGVAKTITAYTGVKIYVDDVLQNPTDVNGNTVEPFIYNGTTYLPVRAVSQALGKNIVWDGSSYSVFIGNHAANNKPAMSLDKLDYFTSENYSERNSSQVKDNTRSVTSSIRRMSQSSRGVRAIASVKSTPGK